METSFGAISLHWTDGSVSSCTIAGASILLGDRLGLYKAMADGAAVTSADLAKKAALHERYVREWLSGQAASGYIEVERGMI